MENPALKGNDQISRSSPLFWLSLIAILGIIFLGARFLVAPRMASAAFGVPLEDGNGVAFAYTKGIRDIFSGLVGLPFLLTGRRRAVGCIMLIATIIPIADGLIMMKFSGPQPKFLGIHWGAALYMIVLASFLLKTPSRFARLTAKMPGATASCEREDSRSS